MTSPTTSSSSYESPFRTDCLVGKIAVVTGGGSGIGLEIARQLLLHGCEGMVICGRRPQVLQRAVSYLSSSVAASANAQQGNSCPPPSIQYQVCDVRQYDQCEQVMQFVQTTFPNHSGLDILINGAAGNFLAPSHQLTPKGFHTVMAIDAMGTFHMCRAAYPLLRLSQHHPVIINISATLQYGATWWQAHASAAKAAVDSLTRSLALEWGPSHHKTRKGATRSRNASDDTEGTSGIRVCGIAPGPIANTPGTTKLAPSTTHSTSTDNSNRNNNAVSDWIQRRIPLGRMGEACEIGYAVIFLCTCQYLTGETLVVDGGEWLYKEPLIPREQVTELSRKIEVTSRTQGPTQSNL